MESKRIEMYRVSDQYGLNSIFVLQKSQELDDLLLSYHQEKQGNLVRRMG